MIIVIKGRGFINHGSGLGGLFGAHFPREHPKATWSASPLDWCRNAA